MNAQQDQRLARLLVQAQAGNKEPYETFLREASKELRMFLSKRMNHPEMIEDVLQDTLLAIHRARHTFSSDRALGPWLYAICDHRLKDFYRKRSKLEKSEIPSSLEIEEITGKHTEPLHDAFEETQVFGLLNQLPEKQRLVIELLKVKDLSVKEVASRTGMSESAVKVNAFRGYQALRKLYGAIEK